MSEEVDTYIENLTTDEKMIIMGKISDSIEEMQDIDYLMTQNDTFKISELGMELIHDLNRELYEEILSNRNFFVYPRHRCIYAVVFAADKLGKLMNTDESTFEIITYDSKINDIPTEIMVAEQTMLFARSVDKFKIYYAIAEEEAETIWETFKTRHNITLQDTYPDEVEVEEIVINL